MVEIILAFAIGFITGVVLVPFYVLRNDSVTLKSDIKKIFFTGKGEVVDMEPPALPEKLDEQNNV